MAVRRTNLDFVALSLAGVPLGKLTSFQARGALRTEEARGLADRYEFPIGTRLDARFRCEATLGLQADGSGNHLTGLDMAAFTWAGGELVGQLRSGTIRITNESDDGAAIAAVYAFPNLVSSQIEVSGELLIPTGSQGAHLVRDLMNPTGSRSATLALKWAGGTGNHQITFTEMLMVEAEHAVEREGVQVQRARWRQRSTTLPALGGGTSNNLLAAALANPPVVALVANTGGNTYDVDGATVRAFLEELTLSFAAGRLITLEVGLRVRGELGTEAGTGVGAPS